MKDYNFVIKVSDILLHPHTKDTILFIKKFSTLIPHLDENGIEATIHLSGGDDSSMSLYIEKATAVCNLPCDKCGNSYKQDLFINELTIQCAMDIDENDDETLYISPKDETLNLEEPISYSLLLSLPVRQLCTSCQQLSTNTNNQFSDDTRGVTWVYNK